MRHLNLLLAACGLILPVLATTPSHAQATRTWVSGVGDDANPCSRTAPCKTFAGAISKTAVGGEINCLDPGGFGGLTITKSITVSCEAGTAGVLVSGTNGFTINDSASGTPGQALVVLRGLDFEGVGTGLVGVSLVSAKFVNIEYCTIRNFRSGTAAGIATSGAVTMTLVVQNSTIYNNGTGINIASTGGAKIATINQSVITGSTTNGVSLPSGVALVAISSSVVSGNVTNGVSVTGGGTANVDRSVFENNQGTALSTAGAGSTINASSNLIYNNTSAFAISGSTVATDLQNKVGAGQGGTIPNANIQLR